MNELKEIFNMCDVMFINADIDYERMLQIGIICERLEID
jgi:hypothetical protein